MADKNNKAESKNIQLFDDSATPRKKNHLIVLILILGIAVLVSLYLNFQTSYKSTSNSALDAKSQSFSEATITNVAKKTSLPEQQIQQLNENSAPEAELDNNKSNIPKCQPSQPCSILLEFTQNYFLLKNDILSGNNSSSRLIDLTQYTINSDVLRQNLITLLKLNQNNHNYKYFKDKFNSIIKPLYKHSKQIFTIDPREYIFIRKIDEKAMQHDDLDKIVFIISQALENNNLAATYENLQKLPQNLDFINLFKQEVANQINIENSMISIENILLNKPDCSIVSK